MKCVNKEYKRKLLASPHANPFFIPFFPFIQSENQ